jgi:hypothetical protein
MRFQLMNQATKRKAPSGRAVLTRPPERTSTKSTDQLVK